MRTPATVTVTGAAGQIGYALLFRIASGAMLGDTAATACGTSSSRSRTEIGRAHV